MLVFPARDNKKSRTTWRDLDGVALGSPAVLVRTRSGSATFCPYLTVDLVLIVATLDNTIKTINKVCKILKNKSLFLYLCTR